MNTKTNQHTWLPWVMWGSGALFYFYQFIIRVCPGVMADDWMKHFSLDAGSLGMMTAFYYYAYAGIQVPLGILMDRFGPRRLLIFAGAACALGCFFMIFSSSLWAACLGRFFMGIGAGCGFLGTMKLATVWFSPKKIVFISGLTTALGTIGGISGQAPLAVVTEKVGWKGSLGILGLFGFMLSCVILFVGREKNARNPLESPSSSEPFLRGLKHIVTNPQIWVISFYGFLMYVPLAAFADMWGVPFFKETYGFKESHAATLNSVIYLGVIVGGLFLGKMSSLFKTQRTPMLLGAFVSSFCYVILIFIHPLPEWALYGLLFLGGIFFSFECLCFPAVCAHVPPQYTGITMGFTNMVIMLSGVVMQPVIGILLQNFWTGTFNDGIPSYNIQDFQWALSLLPLSLAMAGVLVLFIREQTLSEESVVSKESPLPLNQH